MVNILLFFNKTILVQDVKGKYGKLYFVQPAILSGYLRNKQILKLLTHRER